MKFSKEFKTLSYVIDRSSKILLVAHTRPDGDTVGSVLALKEYLKNLGKHVDIACYESFPNYLKELMWDDFKHPETLDIRSYDAIIGSDSVERGFNKIYPLISEEQVTVLIDHHPDITIEGDVNIIDPKASSVCEIIYDYFDFSKVKVTPSMSTNLMIGILGDTGNFQHANTTTKVMDIASNLIRKGASVSKIASTIFSSKKISTLKLWGRALEKARINRKNKMIFTVLTQEDIENCSASPDDMGQIASILNTVPGTKFSLVLSQRGEGIIKGSLRSEEYKGADVSQIAQLFGGGGHKLASGFELKGNILETENGWEIV